MCDIGLLRIQSTATASATAGYCNLSGSDTQTVVELSRQEERLMSHETQLHHRVQVQGHGESFSWINVCI